MIRLQGVTHKGIEVENNSVVAVNSVVQKEFPDNVVVDGIPEKVIKNRLGDSDKEVV